MARSWDDGIGTGVETIDTEHRLQVSLVKALEELVRRGDDPALAARTLARLVDFTTVHFLSEELMMRLRAYPEHDAHKLEHGRLVAEVEALRRRLDAGDQAAALAIIARLRPWLTGHMRSMDQAFTRWCDSGDLRTE